MKKLNKRSIFSVALALMLVFTVGFYSSAEPTTAWFTAFGDSAKEFNMDEIKIEYSGISDDTTTMTFDAATKFADADERSKMFEHACKFFTVTLENTGARNALVFIDIADADNTRTASVDNGVRYYIYEYDASKNVTYTEAVEVVPGVYENTEGKRVIKDEGGIYFRTTPMLAEILDEKIGDRTLTAEEQAAFFEQGATNLIELNAGETKSFCCAVWVEYDYFMNDELVTIGEDGIRTLKCNVDVLVNAVQADHYPVETTVTETN